MVAAQRVLVSVAVAATLAIVVLYVSISRTQGGGGPPTPDVLTVPFVASYIALMGGLLAASLFVPPALRPALRGAAAAGLLVLGWLAIFSIGVAILIAAGLAIGSTVLALNERPGARPVASAVVAGVLAVVVLVAGFEFSWHYLVCPPTGQQGGTTAEFLPGHFATYECNDGVLTTH